MKLPPVELLLLQLRENGFPEPRSKFHKDGELRFHPTRKWRFDIAWPAQGFEVKCKDCHAWKHLKNVAVECDGGQFAFRGGRHNSDGDLEKINTAQSLGWRVYRFSNRMIENGLAIKFMKELS